MLWESYSTGSFSNGAKWNQFEPGRKFLSGFFKIKINFKNINFQDTACGKVRGKAASINEAFERVLNQLSSWD